MAASNEQENSPLSKKGATSLLGSATELASDILLRQGVSPETYCSYKKLNGGRIDPKLFQSCLKSAQAYKAYLSFSSLN